MGSGAALPARGGQQARDRQRLAHRLGVLQLVADDHLADDAVADAALGDRLHGARAHGREIGARVARPECLDSPRTARGVSKAS